MSVISFLKIFSLRVRISLVYVVIVGTGGLITSFVGSRIVSSTILNQAKSKVHHDMDTARMVYLQQLAEIKEAVHLAFFNRVIPAEINPNERKKLTDHLDKIRIEYGLDFLTLTDETGHSIVRAPQQENIGDDVTWLAPVRYALRGNSVSSTEIFPQLALKKENELLVEKALIDIIPTEKAKPILETEMTSGMVLLGATPVKFDRHRKWGVLYGGVLLNKNFSIVDRTFQIVYQGEKYNDLNVGSVTIFLGDLRIATTIINRMGNRAVGTRVSEEVRRAVLEEGKSWSDRAFVVDYWYLSDYEPICNLENKIIGILYVGQLETAYIAIRNKVIFTFFIIATIGFVVIILISYFITRSITKPLSEMVRVADSIANGDLDHTIKINSRDEIAQLAVAFNRMLFSLKKMQAELKEWGNTLELKVKKRTEELAAMQTTLLQSQRLASLGKLAAGIAHEINNPLGGILVLSSLVLEELKEDDPHRENLNEVIKQTMRCRDIVKGLLQFSRQEEGKTEYVNVNHVLKNTLSLIEKQALFHNIKVSKLFAEEIPLILGDSSQLQQVFMNVILNAVQAMKESGDLTINTYHEKKNDMVTVEITDTGSGIPEQFLDRIFDPFFTTKEVGEGTGLGLAIAYGIISKHRGRMTVKSKVNVGTTFTIKIPVVEKTTA